MKITSAVTKINSIFKSSEDRKFSPLWRQILVTSGPLLLTISFGMTSGYSAILIPQLQSANSTITIDQEQASWIASMAALPMAFGTILGGLCMEKFGRKSSHIISVAPFLIGWIILGLARNISTILIGRFLTGLSSGFLGPCTGVYIGETSEPKYRGFLLAGISLAIALGLFLVHLLGTFLSWQVTALISCALPVISLVLLFLAPESPSWLVQKGKVEEATTNFYWCRGFSDETTKEIEAIIEKHKTTTSQVKLAHLNNLFTRQFLKPLTIIVVFIVTNQWAGVNALTFYTVSIMRTTLGGGLNEYLAMLIVDTIRLVMSLIACILLKRTGRRPLAVISGTGTFLSLFVLSIYTYFTKNDPDSYTSYTIIPMASLVAYISFITLGFVPLPWAMMGEVFPLSNRNVGSAVSSFMAFLAFFSVVKTSPAMFDNLGADGTFGTYGVVALLGTVFVWFYLPETKDKALYQIEEQLFGQSKSCVESKNNNDVGKGNKV